MNTCEDTLSNEISSKKERNLIFLLSSSLNSKNIISSHRCSKNFFFFLSNRMIILSFPSMIRGLEWNVSALIPSCSYEVDPLLAWRYSSCPSVLWVRYDEDKDEGWGVIEVRWLEINRSFTTRQFLSNWSSGCSLRIITKNKSNIGNKFAQ